MKPSNKKSIYRVLIVGAVLALIFEAIIFGIASYNRQSKISDLYPKAVGMKTQIETVFQSTLTISDGYLSFMTSNLDSTKEDTETFLDHLFFYDENFIKNIAIIEDTTIKFNYPYEGNESSIGVDLSTVEGQRDDILDVKENLETKFIGPIELVQGGTAFILRIPIVDGIEYWGQVAVVIDADRFSQLMLDEAELSDVSFKIHDNEYSKTILVKGTSFDTQETVKIEYSNKYLSWDITVADATPVRANIFSTVLNRVFGYLVILLICYFLYKDQMLDNQIRFNSIHDALTSDYNRAKFISDYNEGLFTGMLIAFTDVNKFKLLNDTLGHSFGDWCLVQISNKFASLEHFETYRISGDEFILVSKSPMTINQFKEIVPSNKFVFYSDEFKQNIDIEISIGVMETIHETISLESMLMYLDYAMYDAKKENKRFTLVDQELMNLYDDTKVIEQKLIEDIKMNNLIPYYQPIINLDTKSIEGFEVLSRWLYQGEVRSAGMFIDTVKKIKYVDLVDNNLFEKLQNEYEELLKECEDIKNMSFSLNLSAETLMIFERNNERFDKMVTHRKIPIEKLIFEISEDMNLGLISIDTLRYIQNKGYAVSVDDFGAGVSKLSDVLSGELKTIKTDKGLLPTKKAHDKKTSAFYTLIKAIKASGTTICVEGVETLEQLELSKIAGCKLAQGYLFSKPIPKDEVISYVKNFNFENYVNIETT